MNKEVQSSLLLDSIRSPKTLNVKNYSLAFFFLYFTLNYVTKNLY